MTDYQGWTNRDTWAMALNLANDYDTYQACESAARYAAIGNEDSPEDFRAELAHNLRRMVSMWRDSGMLALLPDFDPAAHESADPRDDHGPDDIDGVNWDEIAEGYELSEYI